MSKKVYKETYFQHDHYARQDPKIKKMLAHFRKTDENTAKASICVFWWVIEDMHTNDYPVTSLEAFADDYRCDINFLKSILEDFDLFRIENDCYVSDRVLKNLEEQEEKAKQKQSAANVRWLLSSFNKAYKEFFKEEPILKPEEIKALKEYSNQIPDLKEKLRDIIYTLKELKFDKNINFKPCANWLLKANNLARLVNGEFGTLKHMKSEDEIKQEQEELKQKKIKNSKPSELELKIKDITTKEEACNLLITEFDTSKPIFINKGEIVGRPLLKKVMKDFNITEKELFKLLEVKNGKE